MKESSCASLTNKFHLGKLCSYPPPTKFFPYADVYYKGILKLLLLFLCLPATSDGTQSSVNDVSGGHCNDTSKNVHMKIEVYVCNKTGGKWFSFILKAWYFK